MKQRVYIETTFVSYLKARPSRDIIILTHQQLTREWWESCRDKYELCVSQPVLQEAGAGDKEAAQERLGILANMTPLVTTAEAIALAAELVRAGALPAKAAQDALHIAIAATPGDSISVNMELPAYGKCHDAAIDRIRLCRERLQSAHHLQSRGTNGAKAMNDPIVDEVRRVRDEYAARFNYDLDEIFKDIKEQEKRSGRKFVNYGKPKGEPPTCAEGAEPPLPQPIFGNMPSPQPDAAAK